MDFNVSVTQSKLQASYTSASTRVEKNDKAEGKDAQPMSIEEFKLQSLQLSISSFSAQIGLSDEENSFQQQYEEFQSFLSDIGYEGKPIADLTQEEATDLVSEDGFFGISQTAERIAQFVIQGAGDDIEKLRSGREGIMRGFKEAEEMWGSELPEISYKTIEKAEAMINDRMAELGHSVLDQSV